MVRHGLPVSGSLSDGTRVTVDEVEIGCLTQLAGWSGFEAAAERLLRSIALPLPRDHRESSSTGLATAWRLAPDRLLVQSEAKLGVSSTADVAILDLSEARICLSIAGPGAAGLLSRVVPLDFSEAAFPSGTFAQTGLHHVGVLIDRKTAENFLVFVPTTWARSLTALLADHLLLAA